MPCLPDYAAANALPFLTATLDLGPADLQSPWGRAYPIEISNGRDASAVPPFSIALRIRTPWGTEVQARAVQPGS